MKPYKSILAIQAAIQSQKISCLDLVKYYLTQIQQQQNLNVFLEVFENEALEKANEIDQKFKNNTQGKLAGLVIGIKDVICYTEHHLTCSSKILQNFKSQFNATVVQRLLDEDAIIIGRQNCDEFAMGSSTENSAFGVVRNADDADCVAGGSSGGSAVAVQADMCFASLGSDTGGSVRQPASFCGITGFKPTYSRISRYGLTAYASSFDCIGILANSIEDTALILEVIAGKDDFDSTVSQREVPIYSKNLQSTQTYKIAYIQETFDSEGLNETVKTQTNLKIKQIEALGHKVEAVSFPLLRYILPTYYILTTAEASANLARYDGVRYGFRSTTAKDLQSQYLKTRSEGFGEEVKRRILLGTFVLSAGYYDAYYTKAQKVRRLLKEATDKIFEEYDFIISPTTPNVAFKIGAYQDDVLQMYLEDLYTVHANLVGIPAISIPNGTNEKGMAIGFQIMGKAFAEQSLLAFAKEIH